MSRKNFLKALLVAFVQGLCLGFINTYIVSNFSINKSFEHYMLISICLSICVSCCLYLLFHNENKKKVIISAYLISALIYVVFLLIALVVNISAPTAIFPLRETNAADGIIILFVDGAYIILSCLLKAVAFFALLIKNRRKTGDSSGKTSIRGRF